MSDLNATATPAPQIADSSATPAGITQSAFAARRGVSEPMVSRWKRRGLLVLDADGKVLEAASNARLDAFLDPGRGGDRTGRQRAPAAPQAPHGATGPASATGPTSAAQAGGDGLSALDDDRLNYQREAARDKRASAIQREMEIAKEAKTLLPAAGVANRIHHHVRKALDVLASRRRRLAPTLALETDPRKVEQLLEESDREFCQALAGLALPAEQEAGAA